MILKVKTLLTPTTCNLRFSKNKIIISAILFRISFLLSLCGCSNGENSYIKKNVSSLRATVPTLKGNN